MFENLTTNDEIQQEKDTLGGGGVLESGLYDLTVDHAYVSKSTGGAMALNVKLSNKQGQRVTSQLWMTSGKDKGYKNYYEGKNGTKSYLPGFLLANALCLLTVGKEISQLSPEEKVIPLWDFDAKKELPTKVNVVVELTGKTITAGVLKEVVDKTKDTGNVDSNGKKVYAPTGETREQNEIDKFFRAKDGLTVAEIKAGVTEATFKTSWAEKNTGAVRNKAKGAAAGTTVGGVGIGAKPQAAPTKSLFED